MTESSRKLSEWIVFCDECGDHSVSSIDPDFPLFLLSLVLVNRTAYATEIVPALSKFKLDWFDHEGVNLHSYEIRKIRDPFAFLVRREWREAFHSQLATLMSELPYRAFIVAVRKDALVERHGLDAENPYDLALAHGVEAVHAWIDGHGGGVVAWVAESRGKRENRELSSTWQRVCRVSLSEGVVETLEFVPGRENVAGLQLADLIGYPVARRILNPDRVNRAFEVIEPHLRNGTAARSWMVLP
jgi:hypothetical protein